MLGIRNIALVVGYRADQIVTFVKENYAMDSDGTIGVRKVEDPRRFGVVQMEGDQIVGLVEKPETFVSDLAIVGINIIRDSSRLFGYIEQMMREDIRTRGEFQLTDAFMRGVCVYGPFVYV